MFKVFLSLLILSTLAQAYAANDDLVPFETDFCTGVPEGTRRDPTAWRDCCLVHDMYFWAGGDKTDRDRSDLLLKECVEGKGYPKIARVIYYGVRLGSYSPIKFENKKWNFGWPSRPEHQKLSSEDIDKIEAELSSGYPSVPLPIKMEVIQELRSRD